MITNDGVPYVYLASTRPTDGEFNATTSFNGSPSLAGDSRARFYSEQWPEDFTANKYWRWVDGLPVVWTQADNPN